MPHPGAILALDVGSAKIGIAVSDPSRRIASPVRLYLRQSVVRDAAALAAIARERAATAIVVGLPPAGTRPERLARQVGEALAAASGLPTHYQDERFTSIEARRRLDEAGGPRAAVDEMAAVIILEDWMRANPEG